MVFIVTKYFVTPEVRYSSKTLLNNVVITYLLLDNSVLIRVIECPTCMVRVWRLGNLHPAGRPSSLFPERWSSVSLGRTSTRSCRSL